MLNYIDPKDQRPLPILVDLVSERNVEFIRAAIQGLKDAGSVAKRAVPALEHVVAADSDVVTPNGKQQTRWPKSKAKALVLPWNERSSQTKTGATVSSPR